MLPQAKSHSIWYVISHKDDKWTKHHELVSKFSLRIWQILGTNRGPQTGYYAQGF